VDLPQTTPGPSRGQDIRRASRAVGAPADHPCRRGGRGRCLGLAAPPR
jgi:hypothetical protein